MRYDVLLIYEEVLYADWNKPLNVLISVYQKWIYPCDLDYENLHNASVALTFAAICDRLFQN